MTDNVRKIFDMLGVEPNEEFKTEGSTYKCKIDENLYLYFLKNDEWVNFTELLNNLLNGTYKIIKLPKEPKKKKLRNLTPEEWYKWVNKNCNNTPCDSCNFNNVACNMGIRSWVNNKDLYSDKFLDQEIEVEE